MEVNLNQCLSFARKVCAEAGSMVRAARHRQRWNVYEKQGFELVTSVDRAVDLHFRQRLAHAYADHELWSEEGAKPDLCNESPCWILDPLDGTANFVSGQMHVAISVALRVRGRIVLGVVHAPFYRRTYWAVAGRGAFCNGRSIAVPPLHESRRALIATGFPQVHSGIDELVDRLKPLLREFGDIRRLAAPALDICWVAEGRLAGFLDRIHPWDAAAAALIASEAGARVRRLEKKRASDDSAEDWMIAAPGVFERICRVMGLDEREP